MCRPRRVELKSLGPSGSRGCEVEVRGQRSEVEVERVGAGRGPALVEVEQGDPRPAGRRSRGANVHRHAPRQCPLLPEGWPAGPVQGTGPAYRVHVKAGACVSCACIPGKGRGRGRRGGARGAASGSD
jgi:hypothetical protein